MATSRATGKSVGRLEIAHRSDIRTKFITPALIGASGDKWNVMTQIREEAYFTKGRVIVRGKTVKRGEAKKADYILSYKPNLPLAVIEAKDNNHSVGDGMQQALEYAEILDVPFAYSSNGDAFLEHDRTVIYQNRHQGLSSVGWVPSSESSSNTS
jgi:type I restriction enzyme R subunit